MAAELQYYALVILITVDVLVRGDDEYCYSRDKNPYGYFGTKTPYDNVRSAQITSPNDCWTVFIWGLFSHGTRYASEMDELSPTALADARDQIISNHEKHGRGELCKEDLDLLKNWKYPWDDAKSYGELVPQGKTDMENVAEHWRKKFPAIVTSSKKFEIQSSSWRITRDSATAFREKILGSKPDIKINSDLFKVGHYINASDNEELVEFAKSVIVDDILEETTSRLGYEEKLSFDFVLKLYKQCALENANNLSAKSAFCSTLTPDNLEVLEYYDDIDTYYALGYGTNNNTNRACPLARELYQKLDNARKYENPSQAGAFYFGSGQNVITLLTKLGLFMDSEALKHDNYEKMSNSRLWRTSFMIPFASNLVAVMYNCSHQLMVSFYNNERLIHYPGCDKGVCLWSSLREKFNSEILKECPAESAATGYAYINTKTITLIYTIALISLGNTWCQVIK